MKTLPDFTIDKVDIRVVYPGARAEDVELAICQRLEDALDSITFVDEITCEAREGLGIAVVELAKGGNINAFLSDIQTEVDAIDSFPALVEKPTVRRLNLTEKVISLVITGPMQVLDLHSYADQIKDQLTNLPTISQVELQGFSDHQIRIEPRSEILRQHGLSVASLAHVISSQSIDLPSGILQTQERNILVRFSDERRRPIDFENLVIASGQRGGEVRLGEVARITEIFEDEEEKILFNGQRAAVLSISKTKQEDILTVVDSIQTFLEEERLKAPSGVALTLIEDQAQSVRDRLTLLFNNGFQGLVLVFTVLCLFFSIRFSFWVAMGLPVSFLGALWVMSLIGMSINMLTMVALLIAIGILMDDAIVIAESIAVEKSKGLSTVEAAVQGTNKILLGVFSSFLTSICVFVPMAMIEGTIGNVLKVIPVVLISVLTVSLIEAFLILPNHISHSLANSDSDRSPLTRLRAWIERGFLRFQNDLLKRMLDSIITWRYLAVGCVIMLFLISLSLFTGGHLKSRAFPSLDGDVVQARLLLASGTPLEQTEAVVQRMIEAVAIVNQRFASLHDQGQNLVKHVMVQFNRNSDAYESGPHLATVTVELLSSEQRRISIGEFTDHWRQTVGEVVDAISLTYKDVASGPAGADLEVHLQGTDLAQLEEVAAQLRSFLGQFQGVLDLEDDLHLGKPELRLTLLEGAYDMGFTAMSVAEQLRSAFYGQTIDEVQIGSQNVEIDIRLASVDRNSLADLDYFTLTHMVEGHAIEVPLSEVRAYRRRSWLCTYQPHRRPTHRDCSRCGPARYQFQRDHIDYSNRIFSLMNFHKKFPGVTVNFCRCQRRNKTRLKHRFQSGFLLGLLGVFCVVEFPVSVVS